MQKEDRGTDFQKVYEVLSQMYPIPNFSERSNNTVLDTLIAVMLSQNTTDRNSIKAFEQLKSRYEDWNQVIQAPVEDLEDCIRVAGLAKTKATRIKQLLETLKEEKGELSLENLLGASAEVVERELSRFKGVGLKTIACVEAFSLGLQVFPGELLELVEQFFLTERSVDTHVFRVCKRLGWISLKCNREEAFRLLNIMEEKYVAPKDLAVKPVCYKMFVDISSQLADTLLDKRPVYAFRDIYSEPRFVLLWRTVD